MKTAATELDLKHPVLHTVWLVVDLPMNPYFDLRAAIVNVKQVLMHEHLNTTSQAADRQPHGGELQNRVWAPESVSLSVRCTNTLYWHANAGSASWAAWIKRTPSPGVLQRPRLWQPASGVVKDSMMTQGYDFSCVFLRVQRRGVFLHCNRGIRFYVMEGLSLIAKGLVFFSFLCCWTTAETKWSFFPVAHLLALIHNKATVRSRYDPINGTLKIWPLLPCTH